MAATATASTAPGAKAGPFDPFSQPIEYLTAAGWKPLGIPSWESTRWQDPEASTEEKWEDVAIMTTGPDPRDPKKRIPVPVMADDGYGQKRPVYQKRVTNPQDPVPMERALRTQIGRDQEAQKAKK